VLTCFALTLDEPTRSREIRKSTVHILKAKTGVCHVVMVIHTHTHAVTHIQSHALTTTIFVVSGCFEKDYTSCDDLVQINVLHV